MVTVDYLIPKQDLQKIKLDVDKYEEIGPLAPEATFYDFIQNLTDVERVLIEQCYEVDHEEPSLMTILSDPELSAELIIVSDGDAVTHHGSFGWAIGTLHRDLWKCKGPAHGLPIH